MLRTGAPLRVYRLVIRSLAGRGLAGEEEGECFFLSSRKCSCTTITETDERGLLGRIAWA
jgi:hypothetical protein